MRSYIFIYVAYSDLTRSDEVTLLSWESYVKADKCGLLWRHLVRMMVVRVGGLESWERPTPRDSCLYTYAS